MSAAFPPEAFAIALVVAVSAALFLGFPVAATLGGGALLFALAGAAAGTLPLGLISAMPQRIFGVMTNDVLLAIPLFVFMGVMLERSRIADDLLESMGHLFGRMRGGLGVSVIVVGVLLAAAKGVVSATVATLGLIALPTLLRHGYDRRLAAGTVAATATLAQIMPPATVLVLLADQLRIAFQTVQLEAGNFAPAGLSVADIFAGALGPALTLVVLYIVFTLVLAAFVPTAAPAMEEDASRPRGLALARQVVEALIAPLALIGAVLGSILLGLATATEAAAVGAGGALLLASRHVAGQRHWPANLCLMSFAALIVLRSGFDLRPGDAPFAVEGLAFALALLVAGSFALAAREVHRAGHLVPTLQRTLQVVTMIFTILIGATMFSLVFRGFGGDGLVHAALADLPGGAFGAIAVVMVGTFLLGFVMDAFEIIFVVVPIVAPPLLGAHHIDPVWLGVMLALNLQTSYLHPPLGPTLFFLRGAAPKEITTLDIYVGVLPFVAIQLVALALVWAVPELATALPAWLGR